VKAAWREAVVKRARIAAAAGELLCIGAFDGELELWDLRADRRLVRRKLTRLERVLAVRGACLTLAGGRIQRHRRDGSVDTLVGSGATAMNVEGGDLLAAAGREVEVVPLAAGGRRRRSASYRADPGVTALARTPSWLVLGYADGNMELLSLRTGARRGGFSFKEVPASPVERILPGAMETLIVGYANGLLGIWNVRTGRRLVHERLHGPVSHLLLKDGGRLYAATELGRHLVWDLGVLRADYCSVLRQVWAGVPVVWEGGRPVRREPPRGHGCRQ
jgi:hypothetical protein